MNRILSTIIPEETDGSAKLVGSKIFYAYLLCVIAFAALVILPTPDHATLVKYHLSALDSRLLTLTVVIPETIIWFTAFYGSYKLHSYSRLIKGSKEGRHIGRLSRGLLLLAIGLPTTAIFRSILTLIATHDPSFKAASVVITNYFNLIFPLLAFVWISRGAWGLGEISKARAPLRTVNVVVGVTIVLGVIFCCLIVLDHAELRKIYHMSPELVMLTLGAPYIYIWFLGLFSVAELREYSRSVRGIVYRKSWRLLTAGIASIILLSILLQYLSTLSSWLTSLSLAWILLLLYVLLLLLTGAYIVVALGAQRLTNIEEA